MTSRGSLQVTEKARKSAENSGISPVNHFTDVSKMVKTAEGCSDD